MKLLITGASGYVGSKVAACLAKSPENEVYVLGRNSSNFSFPAPIQDKIKILRCATSKESIDAAVCSASPDVAIHLAAQASSSDRSVDVESLITGNILFGTLLMDALVATGVRAFINTGTFWEHVNTPTGYHPIDLYSALKRAFSDILVYYSSAFDVNVLTLELYGVYGPHDPRRKIMSLLCQCAESGEHLDMSPGEQVVDLVYIDDVVRAYDKSLSFVFDDSSPQNQRVEIGSGEGMTLRDIVAIYEECVCKKMNISWGAIPYRNRECMNNVANLTKAKSLLNWQPEVSVSDGIQRMLHAEQV